MHPAYTASRNSAVACRGCGWAQAVAHIHRQVYYTCNGAIIWLHSISGQRYTTWPMGWNQSTRAHGITTTCQNTTKICAHIWTISEHVRVMVFQEEPAVLVYPVTGDYVIVNLHYQCLQSLDLSIQSLPTEYRYSLCVVKQLNTRKLF